jgi:apolipoprotein N-acyltransferase
MTAAALAALGALQTLAHVHTAAWPLPLLAVAVLVAALNRATPARAALLAGAFGSGWLLAGVWWLFISMHRYGGLPAWMAALAVLALAVALSLYLALAGGLYARWRRGVVAHDALLFTALWLLAEWARGTLFTGFPWVAAGYSQLDGPLAVWAPWVGVYGIGALLALAGAVLGQLGPMAPRRRTLVAAGVAAAVGLPGLAGPVDFTRDAGALQVRLLQTDVAQDEKFALERLPAALDWVAQALAEAAADPAAAPPRLVVAPETAVPLLPAQLDDLAPGWWDTVSAHFSGNERAALVGVPLGDFTSGYTNSVIGFGGLVGADADTTSPGSYRYDKWHLVPFGEFIPPGFRWFTRMMNIPLGDFSRGLRNPPSFQFAGQRVAPNICYEDLFGEELARRFVDPATAPTVLANVSNIAWFGRTIAVAQHLQISRLRSLELQRPMVRATNTGATAAIDHRGRVVALLPPHTRGVLAATVQGREGVTPYAAWAGRYDLWPLVALALGLLAALAGWRRAANARRDP